jgi:hypothetical protein
MPSFSTRITEHRGGDVLEILCDQKPWGETFTYDDHFFVRHHRVDRPYLKLRVGRVGYGFGVSKAEALILLIDKVKAFARNHWA